MEVSLAPAEQELEGETEEGDHMGTRQPLLLQSAVAMSRKVAWVAFAGTASPHRHWFGSLVGPLPRTVPEP